MYAIETIKKTSPNAQARTTMRINSFKAMLMRAPKLADQGYAHGLPTGQPIPVFPVDMLPGCPGEWLRDPGSYVCPVDPEWGLWFDWTMNDEMNTAVLPTVKGMNPITGQKLEGLTLEEYRKKCPVHGKAFQGDWRFCEECGYKWPPQSYVCEPNVMWWDGFRQADGTVRQFFFSEDEAKDIASLVIGKKSTVPAFGFAFFQPKVARAAKAAPGMVVSQGAPSWLTPSPAQVNQNNILGKILGQKVSMSVGGPVPRSGVSGVSGSSGYSGTSSSTSASTPSSTTGGYTGASGSKGPATLDSLDEVDDKALFGIAESMVAPVRSQVEYPSTLGVVQPEFTRAKKKRAAPVRSVAVGAGAMIRQDLSPDTLSVADWKDESSGIIRLYFCFKPQFESIVGKGVKDVDGDREGFMKGLPTE